MQSISENMDRTPFAVEECQYVLDFIGGVSLCSAAVDRGPYVIRVGKVPVATFGMMQPHMHDETPDPNHPMQQTQAAEMANLAFKQVRQRLQHSSYDPSQLREMVRSVCKHARLSYLTSRRQQAARSNSPAAFAKNFTEPRGISSHRLRSVHPRRYLD